MQVAAAIQASVSLSLKWADELNVLTEWGELLQYTQSTGEAPDKISRWLRSWVGVLFGCLAYLARDPGNGPAQLWLTCLSSETYYLHHLLAVSQNPGCASAGYGGVGQRCHQGESEDHSEAVKHQQEVWELPSSCVPHRQLLPLPSRH